MYFLSVHVLDFVISDYVKETFVWLSCEILRIWMNSVINIRIDNIISFITLSLYSINIMCHSICMYAIFSLIQLKSICRYDISHLYKFIASDKFDILLLIQVHYYCRYCVILYWSRNDMIKLRNCMEVRIQTHVIRVNRNSSLYRYMFSDIYSRRAQRYLTFLLLNVLFRAAMQIDHVIPRSNDRTKLVCRSI